MDNWICIIGLFLLFILSLIMENYNKKNNSNKNYDNTPTQVYKSSDLIIIRDKLNDIDISSMTKQELVRYCKKIENNLSDSSDILTSVSDMTSDEQFKQSVNTLKEILNNAPLDFVSEFTMDDLWKYTQNLQVISDKNYDREENRKSVYLHIGNKREKASNKDCEINPALEKEMGYMDEYGWDEKEPIKNKLLRTEKISNYEYYEKPYEREEE